MPRSAPQPRRSQLPVFALIGVALLVGLFVLYRSVGGGGGAATTLQPVVMSPQELNRVPGISQGSPDAPVVVMEFGDFECGACARFGQFVKPLIEDYIANGTVRFVWYDYPLVQIHPHAVLAARAGRCANEQGRFWPFHDALFARHSEWTTAGNALGHFEDYAQQVGLDRPAFSQCLRSDRFVDVVSASHELGSQMGVSGTPTLFVNSKRIHQIPQRRAEWEALIRDELGAAAPAPAAETEPAGS